MVASTCRFIYGLSLWYGSFGGVTNSIGMKYQKLTLLKTNKGPENRPSQKESMVSQPLFFKGYVSYVSFRERILILWVEDVDFKQVFSDELVSLTHTVGQYQVYQLMVCLMFGSFHTAKRHFTRKVFSKGRLWAFAWEFAPKPSEVLTDCNTEPFGLPLVGKWEKGGWSRHWDQREPKGWS